MNIFSKLMLNVPKVLVYYHSHFILSFILFIHNICADIITIIYITILISYIFLLYPKYLNLYYKLFCPCLTFLYVT